MFVAALCISVYANAQVVEDVVPEVVVVDIDQLITSKAKEYGVSQWVMHYIIERESQYDRTARGDKYITCKRTGQPVNARGLVQITECYFPDVTDEQADDPEYSIDFLARKLSEGKCNLWSTCPL